jgi:DNA-binding response OmpR family regulator
MLTHILIADDDRAPAEAVSWYLEAEGFRVTIVADGDATLAASRADPPQAVILDIMMPGPDGFEVCRLMRRESDVPILTLSARAGEPDKVRALSPGHCRLSSRAARARPS